MNLHVNTVEPGFRTPQAAANSCAPSATTAPPPCSPTSAKASPLPAVYGLLFPPGATAAAMGAQFVQPDHRLRRPGFPADRRAPRGTIGP
jgi:hypothetical protein